MAKVQNWKDQIQRQNSDAVPQSYQCTWEARHVGLVGTTESPRSSSTRIPGHKTPSLPRPLRFDVHACQSFDCMPFLQAQPVSQVHSPPQRQPALLPQQF